MRIAIFIVCIICTSCSPQKRLNRLLDKHPMLVQKDTITVNDTLVTLSVVKDTLVSLEQLYDTMYITKDKLSIKIVRVKDSIYVRGECASDTIYYEKKIPIEKIVYKPKKGLLERLKDIPLILLLFIIIYFIARNYLNK